jgi:ATP-dependent DNA helicase RecG
MQEFSAGKIDILVSTTVIEVGVDVPNATVMVVWDADRFGLATLHQLRGRVGRGDIAGDVFLVSAAKKGSSAKKRLQALEKTTDGLELAELDLRLRHEGDVLGYKQSGAPTLKLVDLIEDADLVEAAHEDAVTLLTADPELVAPTHAPLAHEVKDRYRFYFDEGAGA